MSMRGMFDFLNRSRTFFGFKPIQPPAWAPTDGTAGYSPGKLFPTNPDDKNHPFQKIVGVFLAGMLRDITEAFDAKTDPVTGEGWAPRKDNLPHPLLVLTGDMRRAAYTAVHEPKVTVSEKFFFVEVAMDQPEYSIYHHTGTSRMPQRRFFGVSPTTEKDVESSVMKLIESLSSGISTSISQ